MQRRGPDLAQTVCLGVLNMDYLLLQDDGAFTPLGAAIAGSQIPNAQAQAQQVWTLLSAQQVFHSSACP